MNSNEIRRRFLAFFEKRGHTVVPSAPLVPENDPSVLFNTAGMQPLVPYLMGAQHPTGTKRIADSQKCVRTNDIDEVGDNTHATFFEMLGNWSLGDYFKEETIQWSFEFLTSKEEGLGLDAKRLYVTVFEGDENAPRDEEVFEIWKKYIPENRIYFMGAKSNWWSPGDNGPCGPDTEMFYDVTKDGLGDMTKEEYMAADDRQDVVEIWNDVFMEYEKKDGKVIGKLKQKNVDTGSGLERVTMVVQGKNNIFETDLLAPIVEEVDKINREIKTKQNAGFLKNFTVGSEKWMRRNRIFADHLRTSAFLISDGVLPSNKERGYILRRLMRRTMGESIIGLSIGNVFNLIEDKYSGVYENLNAQHITRVYQNELNAFVTNALNGFKEIDKKYVFELSKDESGQASYIRKQISGSEAFYYFSTFGITVEAFLDHVFFAELSPDFKEEYEASYGLHQEISRAGSEQKFKGGLANHSEKTTMLHTCTHLMLAGLRKYLGTDVHQGGSNITEERTRFDFTYPQKVERDVLDKVEAYVNEAIQKKCDVVIENMKKEDAKAQGVEGSFWEKYPDVVNVYMVKCTDGTIYSQELCGGPHVKNTGDINGVFKIKKEEASSAGVRRIKAVID